MPLAPVIFIFFNRPALTAQSFATIRAARPTRLHLIADGPRESRPEDAGRCAAAREAVEAAIDWPCEVTRDYSPRNLGCGRRVSSGLTAAFAELGEAIVVEDDIVPRADFFPFCTRLLAEHRDNPRIHSICGFNALNRYQTARGPAVASLHSNMWGWASWQRSWRDYRFDLDAWADPAVRETVRAYTADELLFSFYRQSFEETIAGRVDSWDAQWAFTMLQQRRHVLTSTVNLVENRGFQNDATHTHQTPAWVAGLKAFAPSTAPQRHSLTQPDRQHDRLMDIVMMSGSPLRIAVSRLAARSRFLTRWAASH